MSIRTAAALLCAAACVSAAADPVSLADAARRNDYAAFEALFAAEASQPRAARDLHEVWTYAVTDPTGAFYGGDMYNALASTYPDFAAQIQELAVDDANGNRFYPTAETKLFLIEKLRAAPAMEVEPPVTPHADRREAGRSTAASPDAFTSDIAKLGEFPAPRRRMPRPQPVAPAQMDISTENGRGIFFIIVALIAAGVGILTVRTPGERID
ncbi:MAG: hypothetical protein ACXW2F_13120 [Thermoanaerobaculia bacterium]